MENLTTFVSSRGILKSCDCHNTQPISCSQRIDDELLAGHCPGGSIYVCSDALGRFSESYLNQIDSHFVLVTGDGDVNITQEFIHSAAISRILENKNLLAWHAQNLLVSHPKLYPIPIGLEYHLLWEQPGVRGLRAVTPIAQEHALLSTLAASPPLSHRYLQGYCNWHFNMQPGDRTECQNRIDKSACFIEAFPAARHSAWARQAHFMYVVSPGGGGRIAIEPGRQFCWDLSLF